MTRMDRRMGMGIMKRGTREWTVTVKKAKEGK